MPQPQGTAPLGTQASRYIWASALLCLISLFTGVRVAGAAFCGHRGAEVCYITVETRGHKSWAGLRRGRGRSPAGGPGGEIRTVHVQAGSSGAWAQTNALGRLEAWSLRKSAQRW